MYEDPVIEIVEPNFATLYIASRPVSQILNTLKHENATLEDLKDKHLKFNAGTLSSDYAFHDGILFYRQRYYISVQSSLKSQLLHEFHATPMAGHAGVKRTLVRLSSRFFWPNMRKNVEAYVAACLICQQTKYSTQVPAGLVQPLPVPAQVWEEVTMDFITGLPASQGFTVILVVVDRLTKSAHFAPLSNPFTAVQVVEVFADKVIKLHGFPCTIISDRDTIFINHFWKKLFELSGTTLHHNIAYHPQTDGQTEVVNRSLEQYLRAFTGEQPTKWVRLLGWAELCYNIGYHSGIKMSPYQALYGRPPPFFPAYSAGSTTIQALDEMLKERDEVMRTLKENLRLAQHRMEQKANAHRRELVLVRLQPYRQITVAQRSTPKLNQRHYGPFRVIERLGSVAHRLDLSSESRIHHVFHISMLKPYKGTAVALASHLPSSSNSSALLSIPAAICATRVVIKIGQPTPQILVQWQNIPPEGATWEDFKEFCKAHPHHHLEDKVNFQTREVDTTLPLEFPYE